MIHTPVDWLQDPFSSRSWCFQFNSLTWLKPLLATYDRSSNRQALEVAHDLVIDWTTSHMAASTPNQFAWYDMAVGLRSPYIAYVLRAGLYEDLGGGDDAALLLQAALRHATELARQEQYASGHNHGLFQDEGLYLLAQQLPVLPLAAQWKALASARLKETLSETICVPEGGHLEHSTSYQFSIASMVERLADSVPELPELPKIRDQLKATALWHVTPAGRLAQLGDTDDLPAPAWACRPPSPAGLRALLKTGQAFVREGDSYLASTAAYHSPAHKQADETGFLLMEHGRILLNDAGRWGYYEDEPDRIYARSAAAHNVLTIDEPSPHWRGLDPYGSGLVAAGQNDGWYAIASRNLTLCQLSVDHLRLLLYKPGQILLIIDDVKAAGTHNYQRYFHFGPSITARLVDQRCRLTQDEELGTLADLTPGTGVSLHHGRDRPTRLGWAYPQDRVREPVFTAVLRNHAAADALLVAVLLIGERSDPNISVKSEKNVFLIAIEGSDPFKVRLHPAQRQIKMSKA